MTKEDRTLLGVRCPRSLKRRLDYYCLQNDTTKTEVITSMLMNLLTETTGKQSKSNTQNHYRRMLSHEPI